MASFLLDENVPRFLAHMLHELGYEALTVPGVGLHGQSDDALLLYAIA